MLVVRFKVNAKPEKAEDLCAAFQSVVAPSRKVGV